MSLMCSVIPTHSINHQNHTLRLEVQYFVLNPPLINSIVHPSCAWYGWCRPSHYTVWNNFGYLRLSLALFYVWCSKLFQYHSLLTISLRKWMGNSWTLVYIHLDKINCHGIYYHRVGQFLHFIGSPVLLGILYKMW